MVKVGAKYQVNGISYRVVHVYPSGDARIEWKLNGRVRTKKVDGYTVARYLGVAK